MWQRFFKRFKRRESTENTVWRLQSLFNNFRRILDQNNAALERMAVMERALGGEYIFDRKFIEDEVRKLSSCVHHVAYNLNALTGNAHVALYDRYQEIRGKMDQILAGDAGIDPVPPLLAFADIGWELEPVVGLEAVCLAESGRRATTAVADGFVVTTSAINLLLGHMAQPHTDIDPAECRQAIRQAAEALASSEAGGTLTVSLSHIGEPEELVLPMREGVAVQEVLPTIDMLLADAAEKHSVVLVQEGIAAVAWGEIKTRGGDDGRSDLLQVTVCTPHEPDSGDVYLLRRAYPFVVVTSQVAARPFDVTLPDGKKPCQVGDGGLLRGSALLTPKTAQTLAETGLAMERILGSPCALHWSQRLDGVCLVRRVSPLKEIRIEEPGPELTQALQQAVVLCRGGQTVQSGVAAGKVIHITDDIAPEQFPAGAIAIARSASPRFAPVLTRAGAFLTEIGNATGHLATVARELRVPAVFGVPELLRRVETDTEITIDAAETVVYSGTITSLLRYGASAGADFYPTDPEYRILRRLLRFILPLRMVDPESSDFTPQGCRSFHDILHYCHELAVTELAHLQMHRPGLGGYRTRSLKTGVPMEIRVLDVGDGIAADAGEVTMVADIRSEPFSAFLDGFCRPEAWPDSTGGMRLRDIFMGLPRTLAVLNSHPSTLGGNLAIVGRDYLNLSLRLGYHFSVIDTYLGPDPHRSYVYFRFAGGLADAHHRYRRACLIRDVLAALDFNVSLKADLVVGRLKLVEPEFLRSTLAALGALTAFTKQLDTILRTDQDQARFYSIFADTFLKPVDVTQEEV